MRGLWLGWFAAVLIGGVAWGQDIGDELLADIEQAAEAPPAAPEALERVLFPVEELMGAAAFAGHPIQPGELVRFFEAGMGEAFWLAKEGVGQPKIASLGPVLVVWHTPDGLARFELFMAEVLGAMHGTGNRVRKDEAMARERRAAWLRNRLAPALADYFRIKAILEGRRVADEPRDETEQRFEEVLSVLDDSLEMGLGGLIGAVLGRDTPE